MKPFVQITRRGLTARRRKRADAHPGPVVTVWFTAKEASASVSVSWASAVPYSKQIGTVRDEIALLRRDWQQRRLQRYQNISHGGGAYASVGQFRLTWPDVQRPRADCITKAQLATCIGELCRLLIRVFADDDTAVLERMWQR